MCRLLAGSLLKVGGQEGEGNLSRAVAQRQGVARQNFQLKHENKILIKLSKGQRTILLVLTIL